MTFPALWFDAVAYSAPTMRLTRSGLFVPTGPLSTRSGALSIDSFAASLGGTTLSVGPGRGVVNGATSTTQGAYQVAMSTTWTQALAAPNSLDRIDLVYLRVWDTETDSSGLTQADLVYLTGTPAASPVAPTIPAGQTGFQICTISVPHTGSPAVTQVGVIPFTTASGGIVPAFTTSSPGSPYQGLFRSRLDRAATVQPGPLEMYDGAAWQPVVPASYPRGRSVAPISTGSSGTSTSGSTEIMDSVLGTLQATNLIAGRPYRIEVTGLMGGSTAAGDLVQVKIRDSGSASTPTTSSTIVAQSTWECQTSGGPGQTSITLSDVFIAASSGTHTFGLFSQRIAGSGIFTPVTGAPTRKMAIYDEGNV